MMTDLTARQQKFVEEYLQTGNGTESYMRAYGGGRDSARTKASALLRNAKVQAMLAQLRETITSEKICDAKEIQERLSAIARRELSETITLPNGEQVQKQTSIRDSILALQTLCKVHGMFINRSELDVQGVLPVVIKDDV